MQDNATHNNISLLGDDYLNWITNVCSGTGVTHCVNYGREEDTKKG